MIANIGTGILTTKSEMRNSWEKMQECGVTYPCCTYGEEYQYNVKEMIRHLKLNIFTHHNDWQKTEKKRIALHSECPGDVPTDCSNLGKCWDGSDRQNDWPSCSCPAWDNTVFKCPAHECYETHEYDENDCQCKCKNTCQDGSAPDPDSCICPDEEC